MKYKYNGQWVDVNIKALDSMPVGTQVEYTGSTIPTGWEQVNDYSTTEMDTGKRWIDGKKIYRKVYEVGLSFNAQDWKEITFGTIGISNIDTIWVENGWAMRNASTKESILGRQYRIQYFNSKIAIYTEETASNMILILEYTKTS